MGPEVLVVDEAASLGSALVALLEVEGLRVRRFPDLVAAEAHQQGAGGPLPVLVVASNAHQSPSLTRWPQGSLRDAKLVIVGTRDPTLTSHGALHVIRLPLDPGRLLELVRQLARADPPSGP